MSKRAYSFFLLLVISLGSSAQSTVNYTYDSSGNRITRTITLNARMRKAATGLDEVTLLDAAHTVKFEQTATKDQLHIVINGLSSSDRCRLLVCDLSGKQLHEQAISNDHTLADFRDYRRGVYIIYVEINGQKHSWKLQK